MQRKNSISITLIIVITLGVLGVFRYVQSEINSSREMPTTSPELQKVIQPNAFFYSGAVDKRDQTQVSINYSLNSFPHVMWLDMAVEEGSHNVSRLITHPLLTSLDWDFIENEGLRLYQQNKRYLSFKEFIESPPSGSVILADPNLILDEKFSGLNAKPLNEFSQLNGIEYVLTTYTPSQPLGNGFRFQTVIDANQALINVKNELVWHIRVPTASSDNPFYLGGVEVNYQ